MANVFLTNEDPELDYSPALAWGSRLIGVFPPGQVHLHPQIAVRRARSILKQMTRDDFLALAGDPVKIGICVSVAAERLGRVKLLRFNRQTFTYILVEVDFLDRDSSLPERKS